MSNLEVFKRMLRRRKVYYVEQTDPQRVTFTNPDNGNLLEVEFDAKGRLVNARGKRAKGHTQ